MRFTSLGSGSSGNGLVVECAATRVMMDCGFALADTKERLERAGLSPSDIRAVVVTHEHDDHMGGVARFAERYAIPIYLGLTTNNWRSEQVWSLGRWSRPVAVVALLWIVVLLVLFSFPTSGNISWPFMAGTVILLLVYYFVWARARFNGPRVMGGETELTEIEREFDAAARELEGPAPA